MYLQIRVIFIQQITYYFIILIDFSYISLKLSKLSVIQNKTNINLWFSVLIIRNF